MSIMLIVANVPIILSVIMLNVIMLIVVEPNIRVNGRDIRVLGKDIRVPGCLFTNRLTIIVVIGVPLLP
jgi:hypothetical protein